MFLRLFLRFPLIFVIYIESHRFMVRTKSINNFSDDFLRFKACAVPKETKISALVNVVSITKLYWKSRYLTQE